MIGEKNPQVWGFIEKTYYEVTLIWLNRGD